MTQWVIEMIEEKKRPDEVLGEWWNDAGRVYASDPPGGMVAHDILDALRGAGYVVVPKDVWTRMLRLSRAEAFREARAPLVTR